MQPFNLSLGPRLALALLSGLLTFPAILLDAALGPENYPPVFSWWIILHGLTFGLLVMAPFVVTDTGRGLRVAVLAIAGILIYDVAVRIPDLVAIDLIGDTGHFVIAGVSGALLVATAVRFIAPLAVTPVYWGLALLAGVVGGLVFSLAFVVCDWNRCASAWLVLPYSAGWITWQSLVCVAMFVGIRRDKASGTAYGVSVR